MKNAFLELIRRTSTVLPPDVSRAIGAALRREPSGSPSRAAFQDILANCKSAAESSRPLCQDTGTNIWYVHKPADMSQESVARSILQATREATKRAYLRPNAVVPPHRVAHTDDGDPG